MRVAMIGSGYVGLVSGTCFSEFGHEVVCVDKDASKIEALSRGEVPIFEPGLQALVAENMSAGRLSFSTDLAASVAHADAVFIAVGTPSRRGDGHADLSYVYGSVEEIAAALAGYTVVVTKSTVPVGTGAKIEEILGQKAPDADYSVVSNPEFLREGSAIDDFMRPDRVIVGSDDNRARSRMEEIYRPLNLNRTPIMFTDRQTAELTKYAANALLATKITFINEIADLCEKVDANVQEVARGIGLDGRIGPKFLNAGPGYGGSCFPKDTLALLQTASDFDSPLQIVGATVAANDARKVAMAAKVVDLLNGNGKGRTVAVLGLTFKPNTDDMRDAPSLTILPILQAAGAQIRAYDPHGMKEAAELLDDITYCPDAYAAAEGADVLLIITEWNEFRALNLARIKTLMATPNIVDLRDIYNPKEVRSLGFTYRSVGRL